MGIYISGESGEHVITRPTSLKETHLEVTMFSFGDAYCLVAVPISISSKKVQSLVVQRFFSVACIFSEVIWVLISSSWTTTLYLIVQRMSQELFKSGDIQSLDWPARFPDVNPIENMWDTLGRCLATDHRSSSTIPQLRLALQVEWNAICQELLDNLVISIADDAYFASQSWVMNTAIMPTKD